jgi:hypothetical protein
MNRFGDEALRKAAAFALLGLAGAAHDADPAAYVFPSGQ